MSTEEVDQELPCIKVDKWDGCAVKNALDDSVKSILMDRFKLKEHHRLMDMRLSISLLSVFAAMFGLVWDFTHPFPASRPVLIICVISYFVLMAVLTIFTSKIEGGIFFEAKSSNGSVTVTSCLDRFDHRYKLTIDQVRDGANLTAKKEESVAQWFTVDGELLYPKLDAQVTKLYESMSKEKKTK